MGRESSSMEEITNLSHENNNKIIRNAKTKTVDNLSVKIQQLSFSSEASIKDVLGAVAMDSDDIAVMNNTKDMQDGNLFEKGTKMLDDIVQTPSVNMEELVSIAETYNLPPLPADSFRICKTGNNVVYYECNDCDLATKSKLHLVSHIHAMHGSQTVATPISESC